MLNHRLTPVNLLKFIVYILGFKLRRWKARKHEQKLFTRMRMGDEHAFREFVHQYYDDFFHYALLHVKCPKMAKALASKAFLKTWTDLLTLNIEETPNFSPYVPLWEVVLSQLRVTVQGKESLQQILDRIERLSLLEQGSSYEPDYDIPIKSVGNDFLQQELLYKLTTTQG